MELEKTKNSINGFLAGIVNLLISTVMPFVLRTTMVYVIGIEYAGINSLFASIFNVISLADLGFTSAVVYSMYQPIKENNIESCPGCLVITAQFITMLPALSFSVRSLCHAISQVDRHLTDTRQSEYLCAVSRVSVQYHGRLSVWRLRASILIAHRRTDVFKIVQSVIMLVGYTTAQIVILLLFRNYYLYLIVILMNVAVVSSSEAYAAKKLFPHIKPKKGLGNDGKKNRSSPKVSDLLFKRIGTTVSTSLDSVIISRYLGLAAVAIYGNYYYVYTAAMSFMNNFFAPLTAGIGDKTLNASKEENKVVFNRLNTYQ